MANEPSVFDDEDVVTEMFETWYNRTFAARHADTKHINDSEDAFRAGIAAVLNAMATQPETK